MIYLDNAATTQLRPEVKETMLEAMDLFGNPSSVHQYGRKAKEQILAARDAVAQFLGTTSDHILFTASGSESDTMAIRSMIAHPNKEGNHLLTSAIEHPAVLETMKQLEQEGYEVDYVHPNEKGEILVSEVAKKIRKDTIAASFMYVNNETGMRLPIAKLASLFQKEGILFHVDAVQAFGLEEIQVEELGMDFLSAAGHKINGPKGIGILYAKDEKKVVPVIRGGEQEYHKRAGTENTISILGLKTAIECLTKEERKTLQEKYLFFQSEIIQGLEKARIEFKVNGQGDKSPHVLNLYLPKMRSDILLLRLDIKGIAISTGSACTAGNIHPSHVLEAMYGKEADELTHSIRLSFGYQNTKEEIDQLITALVEILG